jgi:hypothetical protein
MYERDVGRMWREDLAPEIRLYGKTEDVDSLTA